MTRNATSGSWSRAVWISERSARHSAHAATGSVGSANQGRFLRYSPWSSTPPRPAEPVKRPKLFVHNHSSKSGGERRQGSVGHSPAQGANGGPAPRQLPT